MNYFSRILQITFIACLSLLVTTSALYSQQLSEKKLVQLSGIISSKRIGPIPFANVKIKSTYRGSYAAFDGFYSFAVREKDTIEYTAVGFKRTYVIIPENLPDHKFLYSPLMESDTISFQGPLIGPRMSYEQFKLEVLNLRLSDGYAENARRNLDPEVLADLYRTLERDGGENGQVALQQFANSFYYSGYQTNYNMMGGGTPVPTSLTNPFAWAQFFKAIKDGDYKKKKKEGKYDF